MSWRERIPATAALWSAFPAVVSRTHASQLPYIVDDMSSISKSVRLGGVSEIAAELGVTRQQVANLRQREDFPAPVADLSIGEVWDLAMIRRWNDSGLRRGAGRPVPGHPPIVLGRRFLLGSPIGGGGFAVVHSAQDSRAPVGTQVGV